MLRGEVWDVSLDPSRGSEQRGYRLVIIISPNSMNQALETKVVIPLTTKLRDWPSRVNTSFLSNSGQAMCEQIRTISSKRLSKKLGRLSDIEVVQIVSTIKALYGEV